MLKKQLPVVLSVLAFLIPEGTVITYPLQIVAGTVILTGAALLLGRRSCAASD